MAKLVIDVPANLERMKPKSCPPRRFSTGNSVINFCEPKPIPNYLRASIGSCHDFCKYGNRRDFQAESWSPISPKQDHDENMVLEARSQTNCRGKKASATKNLVPLSSRQQPSELKPNPLARTHQLAEKQPNKTSLKSTNNTEISRNDADKGVRTRKASKNNSSLPLTSSSFPGSSVQIPTVKIRTSKNSPKKASQLGSKKSVRQSKTCNKTSHENVPEKIIHVIEPNYENQNEDLAQDGNRCTTNSSSPNQKQNMDSAAKTRSRGIRIGKVDPKENDSSPRKLKIKREKFLEIENREAGPKDKSLRRVVSDGEIAHKKNVSMRDALRHQAIEQKNMNPDLMNTVIEETASKLGKMSTSKVKVLVNAFETLINIQDSESSGTFTTSG